MIVKTADFVSSANKISGCPAAKIPEFAFIGRSNVGKSSLINLLTNRAKLAKTSTKPGKTQLINHFIINGQWHLVDLPGYGFARASRTERNKWEQFIVDYLLKREQLICTFVLLDSRLEPQKIDLEFMAWLGEKEIPFVMVFTKSDKLGEGQLQKNLSHYKKVMLTQWEEMPTLFITSSEAKRGKEEILDFIEQNLTIPIPN